MKRFTCRACKKVKTTSMFAFASNKRGHKPVCLECNREYQRDRRERTKSVNGKGMKVNQIYGPCLGTCEKYRWRRPGESRMCHGCRIKQGRVVSLGKV